MKKKIVILTLLILSFLMPFMKTVNAKENDETKKVTVYVFRGSTCPHCHEAMDYFKKLIKKNDFKDIVEVRHLEVWKDDENFEIAKQVYAKMGHEDEYKGSVPYIVIGEKEFSGFGSNTEEPIETAIKETYENENFVDEIKDIVNDHGEVLTSNMNIVLTIGILLGIVIIIGGTIYFARKDSDEEEPKTKKQVEEPKEEEKEPEETKKEEIKNEPKKVSSPKKNNNKNKK